VILDGLLIRGQRLAHRSFRRLHLPQLQKCVGIILVELDCLAQRGIGATQIFLLKQRGAQQIVEAASLGDFAI
jgi:hypothetical protein